MSYENLDYYDAAYYEAIASSIAQHSCGDERQEFEYQLDMGLKLIERADLALKNDPDQATRFAAIKALLIYFNKHPQGFARYINNTIGAFSYGGLLNTGYNETQNFWHTIKNATAEYQDNLTKWLHHLSIGALLDRDFADKMELIVKAGENGQGREEITDRIKKSYEHINNEYSPEMFVCGLGIL